MKRTIFLTAIFMLVSSFAFAQPNAAAIMVKGVIIDNMCANSQNPEKLAEFVKTHTKQCTLQPQCVASGYSIFSEGKLTKFDKASNAKIADFLRKPESKLEVIVSVKKVGDELSLGAIQNQK